MLECYNCEEKSEGIISISIVYANGEVLSELVDIEEEEVESWVKEEMADCKESYEYSYGLFCPYCLESLE